MPRVKHISSSVRRPRRFYTVQNRLTLGVRTPLPRLSINPRIDYRWDCYGWWSERAKTAKNVDNADFFRTFFGSAAIPVIGFVSLRAIVFTNVFKRPFHHYARRKYKRSTDAHTSAPTVDDHIVLSLRVSAVSSYTVRTTRSTFAGGGMRSAGSINARRWTFFVRRISERARPIRV